MWKGAVSFGLVNVPVKLYSATENHDVQFRQVHREDGGRIKYQRTCSIDGAVVAYDDIAKGYETQDGQMVVLTDEDLADLPVSSSREISVEKFVPSDQIDPLLLDKCYYLEPEKQAAKPYALLRDALRQADRMAVVTVAIRTRLSIAVLRVRDEVIVLQTMLWPDEIRAADLNLGGEVETKPAELAMAGMLVESLAGDYDPGDYEDDYQQAVESLVRAKLAGGEVRQPAPAAKDTSGDVVDLLAALQRSVERAKSSRGEPVDQPLAADQAAASGSAATTATTAARTTPPQKAAPAKRAGASRATATKASATRTAGTTTSAAKSAAKTSAAKSAPKTSAGRTATKKTAAGKTATGKTAAKTAAKKASPTRRADSARTRAAS